MQIVGHQVSTGSSWCDNAAEPVCLMSFSSLQKCCWRKRQSMLMKLEIVSDCKVAHPSFCPFPFLLSFIHPRKFLGADSEFFLKAWTPWYQDQECLLPPTISIEIVSDCKSPISSSNLSIPFFVIIHSSEKFLAADTESFQSWTPWYQDQKCSWQGISIAQQIIANSPDAVQRSSKVGLLLSQKHNFFRDIHDTCLFSPQSRRVC